MKNYLEEINGSYPVRRTKEQKENFFNYVKNEFEEGRVSKDFLQNKHQNIVIGDVEGARVIFTAHYDTPTRALYPNLMMPRNKWLNILYHFSIPIIIAMISLALAYAIAHLFSINKDFVFLIFLPIYFTAFYLSALCFTNKNNKNDNTSGVATVLSIAKSNDSDKVAFVLFDNEEKGLLGSKAMAKKYNEIAKNKLVVNFDCVGNGNEILFIAKDGAYKNDEYFAMLKSVKQNQKFNVYHFSMNKSTGNSDYKNFNCGVGVMACKKGKVVKFITDKIHTPKDTVAYSENIDFLTKQMNNFISAI